MPPRRSARSKSKAEPTTRTTSSSGGRSKKNDAKEGSGDPGAGKDTSHKKRRRGAGEGGNTRKKRSSTRGSDSLNSGDEHSIGECLRNIGMTREILENCATLDDEFQAIKRSYFKKILAEHPDKGGDPELFRRTRTSFEVLRELKGRGDHLHSFLPHLGDDARHYYEQVYEEYRQEEGDGAVPSYEYYQKAAEEVAPGYKVELAKSSRSQCVQCKRRKGTGKKTAIPDIEPELTSRDPILANFTTEENSETDTKPPASKMKPRTGAAGTTLARATTSTLATFAAAPSFIGKDAIRIGSLDDHSGGYGRWCHLGCWRVPYRVWAGLQAPDNPDQVLLDLIHMDQVLLTGLAVLPPDSQRAFVAHVMNKAHWARKMKASKPPPPPPQNASSNVVDSDSDGGKKLIKRGTVSRAARTNTTAVVARATGAKATFVLPRPGVNGAIADCFSGKTFVLSGIFPEVGGGAGLNLGKDRVRAMIQSFGGRVTSAISGKTHYLVVGKEPGMSKVGKARAMKLPIVDLTALSRRAYGTVEKLEDAPQPTIKSFSAGYRGLASIGYS